MSDSIAGGGNTTVHYADEVRSAVIHAYYAGVMTSVAEARARAQSAYVIASATAAGLVTAGAFAGITDRPVVVQVTGLAALALWLVVAALFMQSVGAAPREQGRAEFENPDAFVEHLLARTFTERTEVNRRQDRARRVTLFAVGLTLVALALGFLAPASRTSAATLSLTADGSEGVAAVCGSRAAVLEGDLDLDSLATDLVEIEVPAELCAERTLRIPRGEVRALVTGR